MNEIKSGPIDWQEWGYNGQKGLFVSNSAGIRGVSFFQTPLFRAVINQLIAEGHTYQRHWSTSGQEPSKQGVPEFTGAESMFEHATLDKDEDATQRMSREARVYLPKQRKLVYRSTLEAHHGIQDTDAWKRLCERVERGDLTGKDLDRLTGNPPFNPLRTEKLWVLGDQRFVAADYDGNITGYRRTGESLPSEFATVGDITAFLL